MILKVALQMDPIGSVNINADSTFRIALEAQERGHELFFYTPDKLAFVEGRVIARGFPITLRREVGNHVTYGPEAEVDDLLARVEAIARANMSTTLKVSTSEDERLAFWAGRKAAFPAVGRISPDYYCMDGTIPRRKLPQVLRQISVWSKEYALPDANVFHAGDGNLHPLILFDANKPGELARTEEFGRRILLLCVEVGGTITGEHGVGMEKIDQMCVQFQSAELTQFHALKAAFDPDGLLNPGKAIPTLQRCAEFGAMHVHNGQLAHAHLERY